jgi:hypothetical protein
VLPPLVMGSKYICTNCLKCGIFFKWIFLKFCPGDQSIVVPSREKSNRGFLFDGKW